MVPPKMERYPKKKYMSFAFRRKESLRNKWRHLMCQPDWRYTIVKAIQEAKARCRPEWTRENPIYRFTLIQALARRVTVECGELEPIGSVFHRFCAATQQSRARLRFTLRGETISGFLESFTPLELGYEYPMENLEIMVSSEEI